MGKGQRLSAGVKSQPSAGRPSQNGTLYLWQRGTPGAYKPTCGTNLALNKQFDSQIICYELT
jgi:hypothetical protein